MSSVNLNRQKKINDQMKEVMDDFDRFEYFFASHWKHIVMAAVAVVVVVAVIVTAKYVINKNKLEAAQAFGKATDIAQFEAAFAQYSSAPATAYLQLAKLYSDKKEFAKARKQLVTAAGLTDAPEVQWRARLNLAYLDEMEGKFADGAKAFADIAKTLRAPGSAGYAAEAYYGAGRLYMLAKQNNEARTILDAGRNYIKGLNAEDRQSAADFAGMINSALAACK